MMRATSVACVECGYVADGVDGRELAVNPPQPGQVAMCLACGALAIVVRLDGLHLVMRPPTADEHQQLLVDPAVVRAITRRALAERADPDWPRGPHDPRPTRKDR